MHGRQVYDTVTAGPREARQVVFLKCVKAMTVLQRQELLDMMRALARWRRFLATERGA